MIHVLLTWLVSYTHQHQTQRAQRHLGLLLLLAFALAFLGWIFIAPLLTISGERTSFPVSDLISSSSGNGGGEGAGGNETVVATPIVSTLCNPFDPSCYAQSIASWMAENILKAFEPITNFFQNSSANIITQTPATMSYDNTMVKMLNGVFVNAVDAAFACLLLIGGYNVILEHHVRLQQSSLTELIPRAILVTGAVHFNLVFLGLFIDLENALCTTVTNATSYQTLTNTITGFLSLNPLAGLLLVILVIVLLIMTVLLLFQMVTRIALVAMLIVLAPLGLACFVLPQTMRWGRLWLTTFSSTILVQFLQVTALGLGGMFLSTIGATALWHVGQEIGTVFLTIGTLFLVLKIPGMLQTWALHPMMEASAPSYGEGGSGTEGSFAKGEGVSAGMEDMSSGGTVAGTSTTATTEAAATMLLV